LTGRNLDGRQASGQSGVQTLRGRDSLGDRRLFRRPNVDAKASHPVSARGHATFAGAAKPKIPRICDWTAS